MYIRVKRKKQTIFLLVESHETIIQTKEKLSPILSVPPNEMLLTFGLRDLNDSKTLGEQGILEDSEISLRLKTNDGFEPVDITPYESI
eukprot:MONOS_6504.1-p1 / transcript=MONOS_6504.1 / gene=MONOS_6504 / organism=Monocercomonoides_exilis_PA203 / gene_product=unspecified product / transcript_product=unspecified product / location=Mono_scaffold00206:13531-14013(+) / protein_length=87 / sequence_SO=supercontig / SO=protein_coding / is_pseudo=false